MAIEFAFVCPLPNGIHARPASLLEEAARRFQADIHLANDRTGRRADAKSVLGIIGLDSRMEDALRLTASGVDEQEAIESLKRFLAVEFPACDAALPPPPSSSTGIRLPPLLQRANIEARPGTPLVAGIGLGRAVRIGGWVMPDSVSQKRVQDVEAEIRRLNAALVELVRGYEARLERQDAGIEADVIKAHLSVARDPEFRRQLESAILEKHCSVAGAVAESESHFTAMLVATGSALLHERALDIRDVCLQLLGHLYGEQVGGAKVRLSEDSVCLADNLTPDQFLSLDRRWLKGLVLVQGGTTSHTVILARSFGIPTLAGIAHLDCLELEGREVVVDADLGILVTRLTEAGRRYYEMEQMRLLNRQSRVHRHAHRPAATLNGRRIEIAANIATSAEAPAAFSAGAEGIGLFRTEMLFLDRLQPPSEAEQFEAYRAVLIAAGSRPVIIRTLDIGGDKPIAYLPLSKEENPFLGFRAVRLYPEFEALFRDQVRALVKASAFGKLRVMVPMISCLEEVRWIRRIIAEEQSGCAEAGIPFEPGMPIGAMIEIPAMAFLLEELCSELDFFSIGTNDLLQYFMAVDRANRKVDGLYNPLNPAFLRLLKKIVEGIHARGGWVGLCGEMGGQRQCLPLLVGLGLDEISMAATGIAETKAALAELDSTECASTLAQALSCPTAREVQQLMERSAARPAALIDPEMVVMESQSRTKEEALKEIVDRLYVMGRTDRPCEVEEAVWMREAVYSTGIGYGFAIPHCKTDALRANTLALLKLKAPIEWGSLDEIPVRVLVFLAIRASDPASEHMKVLSLLARRLMHEDFRDRLVSESDPESLCRFLEASLDSTS